MGAYPQPTGPGIEPDTGVNLAPVDFVSRAIVYLSLATHSDEAVEENSQRQRPLPTYHLINYTHARKEAFLLWKEVLEHLLSFNSNAERLQGYPYPEWQQLLQRALDPRAKLAPRTKSLAKEKDVSAKEKNKEKSTKEDARSQERQCPALASLLPYFQGSSLPLRAKPYSCEQTLR